VIHLRQLLGCRLIHEHVLDLLEPRAPTGKVAQAVRWRAVTADLFA